MKRVIFAITAFVLCQTGAEAASLTEAQHAYQKSAAVRDAPVVTVRYKKTAPRRKSKNPWDNAWWYEPGLTARSSVPAYVPSPYANRPVEWGTTGQGGMGLRPGRNGYEGASYGLCAPRCL